MSDENGTVTPGRNTGVRPFFLFLSTRLPKVLAPDGIQLFRAPTPSARLDWVTALAIVATADNLGLSKKQPHLLPTSGALGAIAAAADAAAGDTKIASPAAEGQQEKVQSGRKGSGGSGGDGDKSGRNGGRHTQEEKLGDSSSSATAAGRNKWWGSDRSGEALSPNASGRQAESGEDWAEGETAAVGGVGGVGVEMGGAPAPRRVMQGFLRKRGAGRLWGVAEEWSYRWVILRVGVQW